MRSFGRVAATAVALTLSVLAALTPAASVSAAPDPAPGPSAGAFHKVYGPTPTPKAGPNAQAAPASCPNQNFCGYVNSVYRTDQGYETFHITGAMGCTPTAFRDSWSSLWNNSGRGVRVYKTLNCTGEYVTIANGQGKDQMIIDLPTFENRIEAIRVP